MLAFPRGRIIDTGNSGRTGKGTSDVVSLLGRVFRTVFLVFAAIAVLVTAPLQAAPFAAIVIDARTGETLYEKNADARLNPASLTKMMTLYIAFQEIEAGRLSLDTVVTVTKNAAAQPPSRLGLKPGQKIALRYLIRAAAVKSANDAAAAIGDHISGNPAAFGKRMTRTAKQLGMTNSTFRNANGLTAEGHLSSARDMTTLGRHLFYDFPQYYNIFSRRTADAGMAEVRNTNSRFLDNYEGADGIKTGYTVAAGFNLTASALRGDKRIIATVFGGTSTAQRNAKMAELMDIGFGIAKNQVPEQPPQAPGLPDDALVATVELDIDNVDAEGGSGKTVRVSGKVNISPRPKARPDAPTVPDEVAIAMASSIEGALAEATAEPAAEGTLDYQAEAIAAAPEADDAVEDPAPVALAAVLPEEAPAPAGTLEAQATALASGALPAETPGTPETALAALAPDPAILAAKPKTRPEDAAAELVATNAETPAEDAAAEPASAPRLIAAAAPEVVVTDAGEPTAEVLLADDAPPADLLGPDLLGEVTDVQTVAGATNVPPQPVELAMATITAPRKAPIFDSAEPAAEPVSVTEQEVVVVMSTSGGRHFGVNVGDFASRSEAEKALLKTALAESATLNDGLRKITQKDGTWHANFMGLSEDQAALACRRLHARAIPCETLGG